MNQIMTKKGALNGKMVLKALNDVNMDADKLRDLMNERDAEKALDLRFCGLNS